MQKKVLKLKKVTAIEELSVVVQETPKKVLKLKKTPEVIPLPQEKPKKILVLQKGLPVPPVPTTGPITRAIEAFEAIREYYVSRDEPIPQADIKWFHAELEQEAKENDAFWSECSITKAYLDARFSGATDDEIDIAVAKAQIEAKNKPIKESDLGPTPSYGTPEFWAWCMKRKKLKLQKVAEIIAAGGTVPPEKPKKPKAPKKPKVPEVPKAPAV